MKLTVDQLSVSDVNCSSRWLNSSFNFIFINNLYVDIDTNSRAKNLLFLKGNLCIQAANTKPMTDLKSYLIQALTTILLKLPGT